MDIIKTIRNEIDRRYEENREKARYDDYYRGMNDGLDSFESFLDTLQEPEVDLEREIDKAMKSDLCPEEISDYDFCCIARHFAQWGAENLKK